MDENLRARTIRPADRTAAGPVAVAEVCVMCGAALRSAGPGRKPIYCTRACSSRAYRLRVAEGQRRAVAEALIASRTEIPAPADDGARELLALAAGVQRATARYLENLEGSRRGAPDAHGREALDLLERSVTSAADRLLRRARMMRYGLLAERPADTPEAG